MPEKVYKYGKRGFAAMSIEKRTAIAKMGGETVQATGQAHHWTPKTAAVAGRLGGLERQRRLREANK